MSDSRIEKLLKAILGQEVQLEPRESRVERLLYAILTGGSHDEPTLSEMEDILLCILNGERYDGPTSSRINALLKVKANGGSYDEPRLSRIEELIYEWINGGDISTYTGTLPAFLHTVAGYLESYKIYGNTVQDGTPTPENPIMPSGCGKLETTGVHAGQYKLTLTSAGQNVDIYLGESQTTRRIGKIDLGTLNWSKTSSGNFWSATTIPNIRIIGNTLTGNAICDMFKEAMANDVATHPYSFSSCLNNAGRPFINKTGFEDLTVGEFKQAMSGVYMYYVLATEETGILNEPLRKIGDYADTIDSTQTSVQIPTAANSTTISWAGSGLAPSEVEFEYERRR